MAQPHSQLIAFYVRRFSRSVPLLIAASAFFISTIASATDGTWTSLVSGTWQNPANWQGGSVAQGADATANFTTDIGASVTVTIDDFSRTIGTLNIGDVNGSGSYTIAATGGFSLIFDNFDYTNLIDNNAQINVGAGSAGDTISAPISLNSSLDITNNSATTFTISGTIQAGGIARTVSLLSGNALFSGVISNGGGIITVGKSGTGTLTLSNVNSYTGGTLINSGTVSTSDKAALGTGTVTLGSFLGGNATLSLTFTGGGGGGGPLANNIVVAAGSGGTLTLAETAANSPPLLGTITLNGELTLSSAANSSNPFVVSGLISGAGSLTTTASSAGGTTLSGANTYSGGTTLTNGPLQGKNSGATNVLQAFGTGPLTLNGGTLQLRANGSGNSQTIITGDGITGNNVVVGGNATIDVNQSSANTGSTFQFNNLSIGANTLTITGGNSYALQFAGTTTLTGNATFNPTTANLAIASATGTNQNLTLGGTSTGNTIGAITTGSGTLTKNTASTWTLSWSACQIGRAHV